MSENENSTMETTETTTAKAYPAAGPFRVPMPGGVEVEFSRDLTAKELDSMFNANNRMIERKGRLAPVADGLGDTKAAEIFDALAVRCTGLRDYKTKEPVDGEGEGWKAGLPDYKKRELVDALDAFDVDDVVCGLGGFRVEAVARANGATYQVAFTLRMPSTEEKAALDKAKTLHKKGGFRLFRDWNSAMARLFDACAEGVEGYEGDTHAKQLEAVPASHKQAAVKAITGSGDDFLG